MAAEHGMKVSIQAITVNKELFNRFIRESLDYTVYSLPPHYELEFITEITLNTPQGPVNIIKEME